MSHITLTPLVGQAAIRIQISPPKTVVDDNYVPGPTFDDLADYGFVGGTPGFAFGLGANAITFTRQVGTAIGDGFSRSLTGLTPGIETTVEFSASRTGSATGWSVVADGYGAPQLFAPITSVVTFTYTFTPTSSTATINLVVTQAPASGYVMNLHTFKVYQGEADLPGTPADWHLDTLTRSDANGTVPVRLPVGFDLSDGLLVHDDAENALTGIIQYTAVVRYLATSTTAVYTGQIDTTGLWSHYYIAPAVLPALRSSVSLVETYDAESRSSSTVFDIIGRQDPLVSIGVQRTRIGTLRAWCDDYSVAQDVRRTAGRGQALMLRQPDYEGLDMYFVVTSARVGQYQENTPTRRWYVDVAFTEVRRPDAPLLGAVDWNFEESSERNATFYNSLQEFPTFLDLKIGPVSG
ncbi:hypothetical protein IU11_14025 [Cellulosimicrobium sp. MM]|nr:hypothetical protein [Cellulosimicrobium sp. MM]KFD43155.1 hypothetical protein IU11_14025 [Cellulosimicrobium sp. MM]